MPRFIRATVFLSLSAGLTLAASSYAQSPSALAQEKPAPATTSVAPQPKKERAMSTGVASALAASMPKYNPPPKPNPADEDVDLREVDKPKNGIVRLPKYTVQEKKSPVFRERDVYSKDGLADLAKNRYLTDKGLNRVTLPLFGTSPEARAMALYAEDERLNNMSELKDNARDIGYVDGADGAYIKRVTDQTYMRDSGSGYDAREEVRR